MPPSPRPWRAPGHGAARKRRLRRCRGPGTVANAPSDWRQKSQPYRLGPAIEERPMIVPPLPPLTKAATLLAQLSPFDIDGPARRMPPFIRQGDRYMPSLGIAAALLGGGFKPDEVVLEGNHIRIRDRVVPLVPGVVFDADGRPRPLRSSRP